MPFTTTASGLQFEDTVVGSGAEAKPGKETGVRVDFSQKQGSESTFP